AWCAPGRRRAASPRRRPRRRRRRGDRRGGPGRGRPPGPRRSRRGPWGAVPTRPRARGGGTRSPRLPSGGVRGRGREAEAERRGGEGRGGEGGGAVGGVELEGLAQAAGGERREEEGAREGRGQGKG